MDFEGDSPEGYNDPVTTSLFRVAHPQHPSWRRADDDFMGDLHLGDGINAIFRNLQSFRNGQSGPNGRTQPQPTPSPPRRLHSADAPMDRDHGHGQLEVEWPRFEAVIDILSL